MSATNTFETSLLEKIFIDTDDAVWTQLEAATDLYLSLHTSDPGEAGDQATGETAYTGYARVAVPRADWTVSGGTAANTNDLAFGKCTASPGAPITHVGIGLDATGAGPLLMSDLMRDSLGDVGSLTMQVGTLPIFLAFSIEMSVD